MCVSSVCVCVCVFVCVSSVCVCVCVCECVCVSVSVVCVFVCVCEGVCVRVLCVTHIGVFGHRVELQEQWTLNDLTHLQKKTHTASVQHNTLMGGVYPLPHPPAYECGYLIGPERRQSCTSPETPCP